MLLLVENTGMLMMMMMLPLLLPLSGVLAIGSQADLPSTDLEGALRRAAARED